MESETGSEVLKTAGRSVDSANSVIQWFKRRRRGAEELRRIWAEVAGNAKAQQRGSWWKQPTEKQCMDAVSETHRAGSIEVSWLSLFTFKTQRLPIAYWDNSVLSLVW